MASDYRVRASMASLARLLALSDGNPSKALRMAEAACPSNSEVPAILRAAVSGGSISDPTWAGTLAPYSTMSGHFFDSLMQVSAFENAYGSTAAVKVPFRSRFVVVTSGATANEVGEGSPVPMSAMALAAPAIGERRVAALVAAANETLRGPMGDAVMDTALRTAVANAQDVAYVGALTADSPLPSVSGTGPTATNVAAAIAGALALMATHSRTRLQLLVPPARLAALALKVDVAGSYCYPDLVIGGVGMMAGGITVMSCGALASDTALLVDVSKLAMAADVIALDGSSQASIEFLDNPTNNSLNGTGTSMVSLFQTNTSALKATRLIGVEKLHADAAVLIDSISW